MMISVLVSWKLRPGRVGARQRVHVHAQVRNQRNWGKYPSFLFIRIVRAVCFLKVEQNVSENNIHVGVGVDETLEGEYSSALLTEVSFPAHLHSSLLVEEAGQGICNANTVPDRCYTTGRYSCGFVCVLYKLKRSQCDLLSTLFQFTPLFIQVAREHLTCQAQRVIVCNSPALKYL